MKGSGASDNLKILGIAGSLRRASYNKGVLRASRELVPAGASLEIFDLEGISLFNQDHETKPTAQVTAMKAAVRAADALLFATPEHNHSIPAALKNALDWGTRPFGDNAWAGKPAAILGASPGMLGTARAQIHLRQILVALNMHPMGQPEVIIGNAADRFDADGNLIDDKVKDRIRALLKSLISWTQRLGMPKSE